MSTRVFIVRPFGTKENIDFDAVEAKLIRPAIEGVKSVSLQGGTTIPFVEQGNIREDMFRELVTADLVIADLSIHNANVFYELGIRHGLRPNATFLLRADVSAYPFDLQTDRYLRYDPARPELTLAALIAALEATLASTRIDSPVYQLLPTLRPPDPASLRVVPREFGEAVGRAAEAGYRGDLRLLAHEARSFSWGSEGLRAVGRAQFTLNAVRGATETFEWLRDLRPTDVEANQRLATLYQRLSKSSSNREEFLAKSSAAIQRVIDSDITNSWDMAEAYALRARNKKARWLEHIGELNGDAAQIAALRSAALEEALDSYDGGFAQDLNHFYSGINALSFLRIRIDLARAQPDVWAAQLEDDAAARKVSAMERRFTQLSAAVGLAVDASRIWLNRQTTPDAEKKLWTEITGADLAFLTSSKPTAVAYTYRSALSGAPDFAIGAVRTQTEIFQRLKLRTEFVAATLEVVAEFEKERGQRQAPPVGLGRVLLFTGHMVDATDRSQARFPRSAAAEAEARRMIREVIVTEQAAESGTMIGVAGGACGGDILFHEVCEELGVTTRLFLAVPAADFIRESVERGGSNWVERFERLQRRVPPRTLSDSMQLPAWLRGQALYTVWQRNNLWMLFNALSLDSRQLTLIALWDQGPADGPGGTSDLVEQVRSRGCKVARLEAERLKTLMQ